MKIRYSTTRFLKYFSVFLFLVLSSFFLHTFLSTWTPDDELGDLKYAKVAGQTLKVDLALTPEVQTQGLSGRKELKEDEAMLFVFDSPGLYAFWMKDMNFPIDIIWIGEDMKVLYIKNNALPESFPENFSPTSPAKYVLETVAGFAEKNNLKEGDKIQFLSI